MKVKAKLNGNFLTCNKEYDVIDRYGNYIIIYNDLGNRTTYPMEYFYVIC